METEKYNVLERFPFQQADLYGIPYRRIIKKIIIDKFCFTGFIVLSLTNNMVLKEIKKNWRMMKNRDF